MKNAKSLIEIAAIVGRPIQYGLLDWTTPTHKVTIHFNLDGDLIVTKTAKGWGFGSEVRRGRPRDSYVINPTAAYLKGLSK